MPMTPEEKRARRKERRQARKASQIGGSSSRERLASGLAGGRKVRPHGRLDHEVYVRQLMEATELEIAPKGPGNKTWVCYSVPLLQSTYPSPAQAAEVILERVAALQLDTVVQITSFPTGGIIGIGPVQSLAPHSED